MITTDCFALRTPAILLKIRTSRDYKSRLRAHFEADSKVFHTLLRKRKCVKDFGILVII